MNKEAAKFVLSMMLLIVSVCSLILCYQAYKAITSGPTYQQVCAPLYFIRKVDYYNDKTYVVCGTPTTDPVLKEYPNVSSQ